MRSLGPFTGHRLPVPGEGLWRCYKLVSLPTHKSRPTCFSSLSRCRQCWGKACTSWPSYSTKAALETTHSEYKSKKGAKSCLLPFFIWYFSDIKENTSNQCQIKVVSSLAPSRHTKVLLQTAELPSISPRHMRAVCVQFSLHFYWNKIIANNIL